MPFRERERENKAAAAAAAPPPTLALPKPDLPQLVKDLLATGSHFRLGFSLWVNDDDNDVCACLISSFFCILLVRSLASALIHSLFVGGAGY